MKMTIFQVTSKERTFSFSMLYTSLDEENLLFKDLKEFSSRYSWAWNFFSLFGGILLCCFPLLLHQLFRICNFSRKSIHLIKALFQMYLLKSCRKYSLNSVYLYFVNLLYSFLDYAN